MVRATLRMRSNNLAGPKAFKELFNGPYFHAIELAGPIFKRKKVQLRFGIFFTEGFQSLGVMRTDVHGRFNFDSNLGITEDSIHLIFVVQCVPIGDRLQWLAVRHKGTQLLYDKMLKRMTINVGAWL